MQTAGMTSQRQRPPSAATDNPQQARLVAVGAVLLQPVDRPEPVAATMNRGSWPIFVIVLDDRAAASAGGPLFELLDKPHASRIPMVHSQYRWSLNPSGAMFTLALRIQKPTEIDLEVVVPARPLLSVLLRLPADAAFAITTKRHADKLTDRVAFRDALHKVVLLVNRSNQDNGLAELRRNGGLGEADAHGPS